MSEDDLKNYLNRLIPEQGDISGKDLAVVKQLISLTLRYRLKLIAMEDATLTVQETRIALEFYWNALQNGRFTNSTTPRIEGLIRLWLKEINNLTF